MKTSALGENWRQLKRWAWRYLNLPHPGRRAERRDPLPVVSAMEARRELPETGALARPLTEHRNTGVDGRHASEGEGELQTPTSVTAATNASALFRTPVRRVHKGLHTLTPSIIVDDAAEAIDFLRRAFGIRENHRLTTREGKVAQCELQLGDSILNLGESMDGWRAHGLVAHIHVKDSDAVFAQAISAGATAVVPMADTFRGSREGRVTDPFGNVWIIATCNQDLRHPEMPRRVAAQENSH